MNNWVGIGLIVFGFLGINIANIDCELNTKFSWKLNLKYFGNEKELENNDSNENQSEVSETNNLIINNEFWMYK